MIEINQLSKSIHNQQVLSDISFQLKPGNIIGLIGRNGAGKTTLLRLLVGILLPSKGDVLLDGKSIYKNPEVKKDIVFVPDSPEALKSYSTREIVKLYKEIYPNFDEEYFYGLLDRFSLPKTKRVGTYSKGMKALFALVLAFSTRAKYILLDEPTDGLDVIIKKKILRYIIEEVAEQQVSVIISSHRLDELEFMADQIIVLKDRTINSNYDLDVMKQTYRKVQVVFKEYLPVELNKKVKILNQTGRVYTLLIDGNLAEIEAEIKKYEPLLYEELSVALEDIFVAKLGGEEYVE
ncbi:ATP-binding cassette domain-containing protein [Alkalihalobacterium elongatum]|uniref:ATP-binding cassette domain-containing protein n=1 Tax=Alkalihalobacterium elongatum TaxID=2675466 RepID=UPI001C1FBB3D|nr:ABC transporter ATP-binding protein [Alkalihalobacterium elongatum]